MHDYYKEFLSDSLVESLFARVPVVDGIALLPLDAGPVTHDGGNFQDVLNEVRDPTTSLWSLKKKKKDARTAREAAKKFESREALAYVAHCFRKVRGELR